MKLHIDFYYRHFRLVKMSKVSLVDALNDLIIWYAACVKWSKELLCFVGQLLKKSKKQINPNTISLKQQNFWCENYPFFMDNGTIWDKA